MINLPPGMKSRNPGTKKIALETPVKTYSLDATYSGHCHLHESMYPHVKRTVQHCGKLIYFLSCQELDENIDTTHMISMTLQPGHYFLILTQTV